MKKLLLPSLILSLILLAVPVLAVEPGTPAPDFSLKTLDGKTFHLSDFKGRPILLKLATTWCPTCKQQTQEIRAAGDYLKAHDVVVIEVFLQDSEQMVRDYIKDENYPMQHLALVDDGTALEAYNVYLIPRTVLIGPDFVVRRDGSLIEAKDLIAAFQKILDSGQTPQ